MRRAAAIATVLAVAASVSGCGGGKSSQQQITDTVNSYYKAFAAGDGSKACELLAVQTQTTLEQAASGKSCGDILSAAIQQPQYKKVLPQLQSAKVKKIVVTGDVATATVQTSIQPLTVPLKKEGGAWKIQSALGG